MQETIFILSFTPVLCKALFIFYVIWSYSYANERRINDTIARTKVNVFRSEGVPVILRAIVIDHFLSPGDGTLSHMVRNFLFFFYFCHT